MIIILSCFQNSKFTISAYFTLRFLHLSFLQAVQLKLLNREQLWIVASYDTKANSFFNNSTILSYLNTSNILILRKAWNQHQNSKCSNYRIVVKPRLSVRNNYQYAFKLSSVIQGFEKRIHICARNFRLPLCNL